MADFQFLKNPLFHNWVISAPRRAKRPDVASGMEPVCPFCPGKEGQEQEVFRLGGASGDSNWQVRVLPNKFPFAPIHEIIIHSPDHHANFGELPISQVELILQTYRNRYQQYQKSGEVYIFHNRGEAAGESLPHPHTQLTVIPFEVKIDIPRLDPWATPAMAPSPSVILSVSEGSVTKKEGLMKENSSVSPQIEDGRPNVPLVGYDKEAGGNGKKEEQTATVKTENFYLFCPKTSQWPDEVWIAPKNRGRAFGEITDAEVTDLAATLSQIIKIFDLRHGHEFPYNFYIYPGGDWYLRIIPRLKRLGGFEIGTNIYVNTQDPQETLNFIKEHFNPPAGGPDEEKISTVQRAEYHRSV